MEFVTPRLARFQSHAARLRDLLAGIRLINSLGQLSRSQYYILPLKPRYEMRR